MHGQSLLMDEGCEEYSNRSEKDKCWISIAREMFSDSYEIDVKERNIRGFKF